MFGDRAERLWSEGVDEVVVDDPESIEVRFVIDVVLDGELVVKVAWENATFRTSKIDQNVRLWFFEQILILLHTNKSLKGNLKR